MSVPHSQGSGECPEAEAVTRALEEYLVRVVERGALLDGTVVQGTHAGLLGCTLERLLKDAGFANSKPNRKILEAVRTNLRDLLRKDHNAMKAGKKQAANGGQTNQPKKANKKKKKAKAPFATPSPANVGGTFVPFMLAPNPHDPRFTGLACGSWNAGQNCLMGPPPAHQFYHPQAPMPPFPGYYQNEPAGPSRQCSVPSGPMPHFRTRPSQVASIPMEDRGDMYQYTAKMDVQKMGLKKESDPEAKLPHHNSHPTGPLAHYRARPRQVYSKPLEDILTAETKLPEAEFKFSFNSESVMARKSTEVASSTANAHLQRNRSDMNSNDVRGNGVGVGQQHTTFGQGRATDKSMQRNQASLRNEQLDSCGDKMDSSMSAEGFQKAGRAASKRSCDDLLASPASISESAKRSRREIGESIGGGGAHREEGVVGVPKKLEAWLKKHHIMPTSRDSNKAEENVDHKMLQGELGGLDNTTEVNMQEMPKEFWSQIQGFTPSQSLSNGKEMPKQGSGSEKGGDAKVEEELVDQSVEVEDIVEVPVPPKPQPPVVNLEDDKDKEEGEVTDSQEEASGEEEPRTKEDGSVNERANEEVEEDLAPEAAEESEKDGKRRQGGQESPTSPDSNRPATLCAERILRLQCILGEERDLHEEVGRLQQQLGRIQQQLGVATDKLKHLGNLQADILHGNGQA